MSDTRTFTAAVAEFLKARPGQWVRAEELMAVGGRMAWRTRISDARHIYNMRIVNRTRKDGDYTISEYKFIPAGQADLLAEAS